MQQNNSNSFFSDSAVNVDLLRKRAYNYRWAEVPDGVIPLTAADPDFPVSEVITDAIKEYIKPRLFSYTPPEGLPEFKHAVSGWYKKTKNMVFAPEHILPVNSAAFGLFTAAKAVLKPGDKALIFEPVDFLFRKSIENAGAQVVSLVLNKNTGRINESDLASVSAKSIKAVFVCNPNNPLGKSMHEEDIKLLVELAEKNNWWIISDEIWADIYFDKPIMSFASYCGEYQKKVITVSGLSKNFGLAGLRVGYLCVSDAGLYKKLFDVSQAATTAYGVSSISQIAAAAALNNGEEWLKGFKNHLLLMKNYVEERISRIPVLKSNDPDSTYLFFPEINISGYTSDSFCKMLMEKAKVALVPGGKNWFEESSEGHIRICYATSKEILKEAFDRIDLCLKENT